MTVLAVKLAYDMKTARRRQALAPKMRKIEVSSAHGVGPVRIGIQVKQSLSPQVMPYSKTTVELQLSTKVRCKKRIVQYAGGSLELLSERSAGSIPDKTRLILISTPPTSLSFKVLCRFTPNHSELTVR